MAVWVANPAGSARRPTLFLDRDGLVVQERNYLANPDEVELVPGAAVAMARARAAGFQLIGVSNQSGIGRGYLTADDFGAVMTRLCDLLAQENAWFDGFYYCPHGPDDGCLCRKPRPGLLDEAGAVFAWELDSSWVLGDKESDVALGQNAGLGSVLVLTGHGPDELSRVRGRWSDHRRVLVADDLTAAVDAVITANGRPLDSGER